MVLRWRKLLGLGVQSVLLVIALVAVTAIWLPKEIHHKASDIVVDHEVIDLAEETRQRAWEFLDLVGILRSDIVHLTEKLTELPDLNDSQAFAALVGDYADRYEQIQVWKIQAGDESQWAAQPTGLTVGIAEEYSALLEGTQEFLDTDYRHQETGVCVSGVKKISVTTRRPLETWGLFTRQHFVFAGRPISFSSATGTDPAESYALVVAMSPDASFFRIVSSPRHIGIVLDQNGDVVINPFPDTVVAQGENYVDAVFERGPERRADGKAGKGLIEESLEHRTYHTPRVISGTTIQERHLAKGVAFTFCESKNFTGRVDEAKQALAENELRELTAEFIRKEWAREASTETAETRGGGVMRAAGMNPNIPRIRLLASSPADMDVLKEKVQRRLDRFLGEIEWQETPPPLKNCDVSVVRLKFDATIKENGDRPRDKELTMVRAAFREELHADLNAELRGLTRFQWFWALGAVFIAVIASFVITRPLKQIASAATSMAESEYDSRLSRDDWASEVNKMADQLPLRRWDEIGDLARALNRMLHAVHESYRALQEMNRDLDARVRMRTEELEEAKTELEDTNAKLRESNNDLLRMNEIQRKFVHSITHELKTPLTSILGYCELLHRSDLSDDQRTKVGIVRMAGQRLLQLVNEILDSQKVVAGKLQVKIEEFDGNSLLSGLHNSMIPVAEKGNNTISFDDVCRLPPISTDRGMVMSVLENLLSNACKFTRDGSISIHATSEVRDAVDWITIRVSDTGRGIPVEKQRLVFSSFPQILSKGENPTGTGLGLFNCKGYAEAIGGSIWFESGEDQGTTFILDFPAQLEEEPSDYEARKAADVRSAAGHVESIQSKTVLVIDDDPQICKLLADYLANQGFDVQTASDGNAGVELAKSLKPGFITLDAMMPGIDGWSVLKNLKADPEIAHIPVIMISVLDDPNHKYKGMALGASDFITKPIDWDRLARTLRSYRYDKLDGTVLVVDDDPDVRNLATANLASRGWNVVTAENGRVALEEISGNMPDLIVLDLLMPEVDGFEFIQELRSRPSMKTVPVLVVTGKELSDEERQTLNGRVERVFRKGGVIWQELQDEIDRLFKPGNR